MGNFFGRKVIILPMPILIARLDECVIPDDREPILDFLEMIEGKVESKIGKDQASVQFRESNGISIVLKVMKRMLKDEVAMRLGVSIFEAQRLKVPIIMDFIQFGGLDLLQNIMRDHAKDDFLSISVPSLLKSVLLVGSSAAIKEIKVEALGLQLCHKCQETVERQRRIDDSSSIENKLPRSCERISRVLMFMDNYPERVDVLTAGMDAVILFARNADGVTTINETDLIPVVFQSYCEHKDCPEIVWRTCLIYAITGAYNADIANQIFKTDIYNMVAENYLNFKDDPKVQQQILWMLGSLLKWPKCKKKMQSSELCMNLFKYLAETRTELLKKKINHKEKFKAFEVVAPLSIRTFLRHTGGEMMPDEVISNKPTKEFKKRRNFDEKPKFGTIHDTTFAKGEDGLFDEEKKNEVQPWDENLQYGQTGVKRVKPYLQSGNSEKVIPS